MDGRSSVLPAFVSLTVGMLVAHMLADVVNKFEARFRTPLP